ncbi:unnamed protein product [Amaranthus hypochondriacus]
MGSYLVVIYILAIIGNSNGREIIPLSALIPQEGNNMSSVSCVPEGQSCGPFYQCCQDYFCKPFKQVCQKCITETRYCGQLDYCCEGLKCYYHYPWEGVCLTPYDLSSNAVQ